MPIVSLSFDYLTLPVIIELREEIDRVLLVLDDLPDAAIRQKLNKYVDTLGKGFDRLVKTFHDYREQDPRVDINYNAFYHVLNPEKGEYVCNEFATAEQGTIHFSVSSSTSRHYNPFPDDIIPGDTLRAMCDTHKELFSRLPPAPALTECDQGHVSILLTVVFQKILQEEAGRFILAIRQLEAQLLLQGINLFDINLAVEENQKKHTIAEVLCKRLFPQDFISVPNFQAIQGALTRFKQTLKAVGSPFPTITRAAQLVSSKIETAEAGLIGKSSAKYVQVIEATLIEAMQELMEAPGSNKDRNLLIHVMATLLENYFLSVTREKITLAMFADRAVLCPTKSCSADTATVEKAFQVYINSQAFNAPKVMPPTVEPTLATVKQAEDFVWQQLKMRYEGTEYSGCLEYLSSQAARQALLPERPGQGVSAEDVVTPVEDLTTGPSDGRAAAATSRSRQPKVSGNKAAFLPLPAAKADSPVPAVSAERAIVPARRQPSARPRPSSPCAVM